MPGKTEELNLDEAKAVVDRLLSKPIIPVNMNLSSIVLNTPFDRHCDESPNSEYEPLYPRWSGKVVGEFCRLLEDVFSHTRANPSIPGNRERMNALYAFPDATGDGDRHEQRFVNRNREAVEAFLTELIQLARENRAMHELKKSDSISADLSSEASSLLNRSRVILVGDKGIGKTTFLNYVLDEFIEKMDESRVIWVRIDLTRPYMRVGLLNWLHWQTLKVIFRYIDGKKLDVNLSDQNPQFVARVESEVADTMVVGQAFQVLHDAKKLLLIEGSPDQYGFLKTQKTRTWIYEAVFAHLVEDLGIGFIFVIDGLDKLGLTSLEENEYEQKLREVDSAILQAKANHGVYLMTMRWDSYFDLRSSPYRVYQPREIKDVPTEKIFANKAKCLEKRHLFLATNCPNLSKLPDTIYTEWVRETANGFLRFIGYCFSHSANVEDAAAGLRTLDGAFGADKRNIFRCLSLVVKHLKDMLPPGYFDEQLEALAHKERLEDADFRGKDGASVIWGKMLPGLYSKHYMFMEAVLLQGWAYCKNTYRYLWSAAKHPEPEEEWISLSLARGKPEPDLFPNVLNYPYRGRKSGGFPLLVQVRILQVVKSQEWQAVDDVAEQLNTHFGYPESLTKKQMEEMRDLGLLQRLRRPSSTIYDEMGLTKKGEFALSNLLQNLEYVALAVETAPLPNELILSGFFPITSYNDHVNFVVSNKVISAINMVRLIVDIERVEESSVERALGGDRGSLAKWRGVYHEFSLGQEIAASIRASLHRLIEDAYRKKGSPLFRRLEAVLSDFPEATA